MMKEPRMIYATDIPKIYKLHHVKKIFDEFGEIENFVFNESSYKQTMVAIITFKETTSAKKCFDNVEIVLKDSDLTYIEYYFPKFTEQMLKKLNPRLRRYIRSIQKGENTFDPIEFKQIEDDLLNTENYEKKFIYSNTPDYNKQQRLIQKAKNATRNKRLQEQMMQDQMMQDQMKEGIYQPLNTSVYNNEAGISQNYSNGSFIQQDMSNSNWLTLTHNSIPYSYEDINKSYEAFSPVHNYDHHAYNNNTSFNTGYQNYQPINENLKYCYNNNYHNSQSYDYNTGYYAQSYVGVDSNQQSNTEAKTDYAQNYNTETKIDYAQNYDKNVYDNNPTGQFYGHYNTEDYTKVKEVHENDTC